MHLRHPFDEDQIQGMFERTLSASDEFSMLDTVFWFPKVEKGEFHEKLLNVIFLDGTFLKKEFDTLLNLVATTTDNRIIPVAHMLHKGHDNGRNTCMFLDFVKRYGPVEWNKNTDNVWPIFCT